MRVLFDNGGLGGQNGGVSRYFAEFMRRLGSLGCEYVLPFSGSENIYFQAAPFNLPQRKDAYGSFISPREFRGKYRLWQLARRICPARFTDYHHEDDAALSAALEAGEFDVFHLTSPHRYGGAWKRVVGKKPIVVTIHDLVPEIMPQGFSPTYVAAIRRERAEVLSSAAHIIAVSQNTKRDLMRLYGMPEEKISVIYHGGPKKTGVGERCREGEPTILFVGRKTGYKNFAWFEKAILARSAVNLPLQADEQLRSSLIARGLSRLTDFSWEKCAKETVEVYGKALKQQ